MCSVLIANRSHVSVCLSVSPYFAPALLLIVGVSSGVDTAVPGVRCSMILHAIKIDRIENNIVYNGSEISTGLGERKVPGLRELPEGVRRRTHAT